MKKTLRFLLAFLIAFILMMVVRVAGITLYTVSDTGFEPVLVAGDHVLVNRWSYGLKVGGKNELFDYGRIVRQPVRRGDLVAFENPQNTSEVLICRCTALPGDSVCYEGQTLNVPSLKDCADADYYWMESVGSQHSADSRVLGFIAEEYIIGRAFMIADSRNPQKPLWQGWYIDRLFLPL